MQQRSSRRPVDARVLALCGLSLLPACQSKVQGSAAADVPAQKPTASASPPEKTATPGPVSSVTLSALRARSYQPNARLLDLGQDDRLSRAAFEAVRLRLHASVREGMEGGALLLLLDDQSPRPLLENGALLRSVVDEDRELSPGWHVLIALHFRPDQIELQEYRFQIELDTSQGKRESGCALLAPAGTVFVAPGGTVELAAVPLAPEVVQLEYYVRGAPGRTLRVPGLEGAGASGLGEGDHRVGVRCYGQGGVLFGQRERVVTVNVESGMASR